MRTIWANSTVLNAADLVALINGLDATPLLRGFLGQAGDEVITRGAAVLGDGGGGMFRWDDASTDPDDGVFVLLPDTEPGPGRWLRVIDGDSYSAAWWAPDRTGATSADTPMRAADAAAAAAGVSLRIPAGTYRFLTSYAFLAALEFATGALLRPLSGATLTLPETPAVALDRRIFDLSGTGVVQLVQATGAVSPAWWGAKGDCKVASINVAISNGGFALVSTTAQWTQADAGKAIVVPAAGDPLAANTELQTVIDAVSTDGKTATLHAAAGAAVSNAAPTRIVYGTDDTAAIAAAMNCSADQTHGVEVSFGPGTYLVSSAQQTFAGARIGVRGRGHARIYQMDGAAIPATAPPWVFSGANVTIQDVSFKSTGDVDLPAIVNATVGTDVIVGRIVTAAGAVTVGVNEDYIVLRKAADEATTVNLPAYPRPWRPYRIKHSAGDASANPVTLQPAGGALIDGFAAIAANITRFSISLIWDGAQWNVDQFTDGSDWS